jgi:hypothetical protein
MTSETYHLYLELGNEMTLAAQDNDYLRYQQAEDQFKALPGRPAGIHPELDLVVPVVSDTGNKLITVGSTH